MFCERSGESFFKTGWKIFFAIQMEPKVDLNPDPHYLVSGSAKMLYAVVFNII